MAAGAAAVHNHPARDGDAPVRVLMVSDIHFDPFWDPARVTKLAAAPASGWAGILSGPASPDRAERFADLQKKCHANRLDSSYKLFQSSLRAMRKQAAGAAFAIVAGDSIAHEYSCKYYAVVPHATAAGYQAFAAHTVEFVLERVRSALPGVPVYAALGNNDSGCGGNRLDPGGAFLHAVAPAVSADVPRKERAAARRDIATGGNYSTMLPAPMEHTRLLAIDDLFSSSSYATCGGKRDAAPAAEHNAWLRDQLARARQEHENVWVLGHIPPGIDPFSTIREMTNVCAGGAPAMFLRSDTLADTLAEFGDVVRLAIFSHTHMDELRLPGAGKRGAVAAKIVPSISPLLGNKPSFVVASVDPVAAILKDYRVIVASNGTGVEAKWSEEYDFDRAYGAQEFSPASLKRIVAGFQADPEAKTQRSQEYLRNYYPGDLSSLLKPFWPEYTCALAHDTAEGFRSCACDGGQGSHR